MLKQEQALADLDGKIERKVATLKSSLEDRMTKGEEQARKNKDELAGRADEVGETVKSLERKLDEVQATQTEGDKEVISYPLHALRPRTCMILCASMLPHVFTDLPLFVFRFAQTLCPLFLCSTPAFSSLFDASNLII